MNKVVKEKQKQFDLIGSLDGVIDLRLGKSMLGQSLANSSGGSQRDNSQTVDRQVLCSAMYIENFFKILSRSSLSLASIFPRGDLP